MKWKVFMFIKFITLKNSILNSDFVIQNGCTSAIESLLLNRTCISYIPQEWKEDTYAKFPNSLGIKAKNFREIKAIINSKQKMQSNKKIKKLKERLYFSKNFISYETQIDLFDKLIYNTKKFEPNTNLLLNLNLEKVVNKLKRKLFRRKNSAIDIKFPAFNGLKIKNLIKNISSKTGKNYFLNTKVNILSDRFIFLKK